MRMVKESFFSCTHFFKLGVHIRTFSIRTNFSFQIAVVRGVVLKTERNTNLGICNSACDSTLFRDCECIHEKNLTNFLKCNKSEVGIYLSLNLMDTSTENNCGSVSYKIL